MENCELNVEFKEVDENTVFFDEFEGMTMVKEGTTKKYESSDENKLDGFSYSGEDFFGLDFSNGMYKNGRFYKCNFRGCPFRKSTFTNVVFDECNLEDVDFTGSTFAASTIMENCTVNRETDFLATFDVFSFNSSYDAICKRVTV